MASGTIIQMKSKATAGVSRARPRTCVCWVASTISLDFIMTSFLFLSRIFWNNRGWPFRIML